MKNTMRLHYENLSVHQKPKCFDKWILHIEMMGEKFHGAKYIYLEI